MSIMKTTAKLATALLIAVPMNAAFAGGHTKGWEATGTQMPETSETVSGKTGFPSLTSNLKTSGIIQKLQRACQGW